MSRDVRPVRGVDRWRPVRHWRVVVGMAPAGRRWRGGRLRWVGGAGADNHAGPVAWGRHAGDEESGPGGTARPCQRRTAVTPICRGYALLTYDTWLMYGLLRVRC